MFPLFTITVVLFQPRDVRNIGAVVRAMKNMGVGRLRLVQPAPFDYADLRGIAHRSEDLLERMELFSDLDAALADLHSIVGTSEHAHAGRPMHHDVRTLATEICARATTSRVGLLFGPEDNGLSNAELDRCHTIVRLPTDPAYPSLNLAQAALLLLYELRMAAEQPPPLHPGPPPATGAELNAAIEAINTAVAALGFVKSGSGARTLRTLRTLLYRAQPDAREAALIAALARETLKTLRSTEGNEGTEYTEQSDMDR
jgi:TrmH family RNA methyltransferase